MVGFPFDLFGCYPAWRKPSGTCAGFLVDLFGCFLSTCLGASLRGGSPRAPVQGFLLTCLGACLQAGRGRGRVSFRPVWVLACVCRASFWALASEHREAVWAPVQGFLLTCLGACLQAGRGRGRVSFRPVWVLACVAEARAPAQGFLLLVDLFGCLPATGARPW